RVTQQYLHSFPTRRSSDLGSRCDRERNFALAETGMTGFRKGLNTSVPGKRLHKRLLEHLTGLEIKQIEEPGAQYLQIHDCHTKQDRKSTRLNSSHVKISYA